MSNESFDFSKFKVLLDENHDFPCSYTFKIISPKMKEKEVEEVLGDHPMLKKPSKTGKFVSINYTTTVHSSDEVIEYYKKLGKIQGVMLL